MTDGATGGMRDRLLLTVNAGSSSLKLGVFTSTAPARRVLSASVSRIGLPGATLMISDGAKPEDGERVEVRDSAAALDLVLARVAPRFGLRGAACVGHRIVHGGPRYDRATLMTPEVLAELGRLRALDPDHMPAQVAIVEAVARLAPAVPAVACFDTAFHRDMPRVARLLGIPRRYEAEGLVRYGFHGLSYTFLLEELGRVAGAEAARGRIVFAHLGSGASLTAVADGRTVDTTMGFTPTSGVPMGTRSGDLDPGVLLYLMRAHGMGVNELDQLCNRRSGLLGVSGSSGDMRDLLESEGRDPAAADAVNLFSYQVKKAMGALVATLSGIDTLVFSGGIGERAAPVRARIARGLEHLGIEIDDARNAEGRSIISTDASRCTVRVMQTDEESIIARQALDVIEGTHRGADALPRREGR